MIKFFFLGLSLITGLCSLAQDSIGFTPSPLFVDVKGRISDVYFDFDYSPINPFEIKVKVGEDYYPGTYYLNDGERKDAFLRFTLNGNKLFVRENPDDETGYQLLAKNCKGFVAGSDSFVVINNFYLQQMGSQRFIRRHEFAEYLGLVCDYHFYKHTQRTSQETYITYLMRKQGSSVFKSIPNTKKGLDVMMEPLLDEYPWLKSRIGEAYFTTLDMKNIIQWLKYYQISKNGGVKFYSPYLSELEDSTGYFYKAMISAVADSSWSVNYFNTNGDTLMSARYNQLYPLTKHGECKWYYPNGQLKKRMQFENGKATGDEQVYDEQGQLKYLINTSSKKYQVFYTKVFDAEGNQLLDSLGNGRDEVFDALENRVIIYEFKKHHLKRAYFEHENYGKVYQYCSGLLKVKAPDLVQKQLSYYLKYPASSLLGDHQGVVLMRFVVNADGDVENIDFIREVDESIKGVVLAEIEKSCKLFKWDVANEGDNTLSAELVIPILFSIEEHSISTNLNSHFRIQAH